MKFTKQTVNFSSMGYISFYLILLNCVLNFNIIKSSDDYISEKYKRQISDYEYDYEGRCNISTSYSDKSASYECSQRAQNRSCILNGGTEVLEYTTATFSCQPGYHLVKNKTQKWVCLERSWSPKLPKCDKICDKLPSVNVTLTCYRNSAVIDCNGVLFPGDKVIPICEQSRTYKDDATDEELVCQKDGSWNRKLLPCVAASMECGRQFTNTLTLISKGKEERFGDSPWNVAIYNKEKILICGGTLITRRLVLTAAHCFYRDGKLPAANYEIVVGKITRNYTQIDNSYQKTFKVKEIRFSDKGFYGRSHFYSQDIAVLIMDGKIERSPVIMPACVHWERREKNYSPDDRLGKISGWGSNENRIFYENLSTAELPFISRSRCLNIVPEDFKTYITDDKFCAGSQSGASVLQGDSGVGFLFNEGGTYYIEGVISIKQPSVSAIVAVTDIADHIYWISSVRKEVES